MKFPILTPELTLRSHDYAWALPHTAVCILNTLTQVTPLVCSRSPGGSLSYNFTVRRSMFNVRRSAFNVRRSTFGVRRSAFDVQLQTAELTVEIEIGIAIGS